MPRIYRKLLSLSVLTALLGIFSGGPVAAREVNKLQLPKQPIQITSDRLDAFDDQRLVVFAGNAVAVQGDRVIRADRLLVYYRKEPDHGREGAALGIGKGGDLERIEAKGQVRITQTNRSVTGDEAVYYHDAQKIIVSGNAVMREGANIIRGDRITVLINENRGLVEGTQTKRVTATIYPAEEKKQKR